MCFNLKFAESGREIGEILKFVGWVGGNFKNCEVWDLGEIKFVGFVGIEIYEFGKIEILKFANVAKIKICVFCGN